MNLRNHWFARCAFALVAVAAAFLVREGLGRLAGGSLPTYITFYPAVMLSALIGGIGPGLFATLVSALLVDYFILPPQGSFAVASLSDAVGLAIFTGTGVFLSVVAELYRRARQQSDTNEAEALLHDRREASARWSRQSVLLNAGLAVSLIILAAAGWQSARNLRAVAKADEMENHSRVVIQELERLVSDLKDAETGQRGYLLTGEERYLEPYQTAPGLLERRLAGLKQLARDNTAQQQRLAGIDTLVLQKISELNQTIELRRSRGLPAALEVVTTDHGKKLMDQIRQLVAEAQNEENRLLQERAAARNVEAGKTLQSLLAGGVLALLLLATVFLFLKQENARRTKAEAEVRHHRDHLQEIVAARTEELSRANEVLQQAKEALRQQREWLRVTLISIGDAVLATDTAGRITFLNPVAESLCGWPENEVLGKPVQDVFRTLNQQTRAPGGDIVARVLHEGRIVALANHTALLARDGREIPIEDSAAPIKDDNGAVSGVVLVFHDVTQKRRAQEALRESRERLELALLSSRMATFDWDIVKNKRTWSHGVHSLLGTKEETFSGTAEEFFQIMHPDDRSAVQAALSRAVESTGVYESEYRAVWPDGSIRHIAARGRIQRDNAGRAILLTGVCWDITERKQAEEASTRLAAIVESSDDAIVSKEPV
jgi:PAS domain S-box-containing protein